MVNRFLNAASIFQFFLSSPSGIATCAALHAIRRFRRQYCSRCSNSDKYTLLLYFLDFSSVLIDILRGREQTHAKTYVTLFERVTCPLLFQLQKVSNSFLQLAERDQIPHAKSKKSAKIKEYCMRQSNTFLQLAKGSLIPSRAVAKGNQIPFRANCKRNLRIACNACNVNTKELGEPNLKFKK